MNQQRKWKKSKIIKEAFKMAPLMNETDSNFWTHLSSCLHFHVVLFQDLVTAAWCLTKAMADSSLQNSSNTMMASIRLWSSNLHTPTLSHVLNNTDNNETMPTLVGTILLFVFFLICWMHHIPIQLYCIRFPLFYRSFWDKTNKQNMLCC